MLTDQPACPASVLQLYTAAINACMTDDHTNFDAAWEIYTTMQRHGVEPDDLLYGHLIAIAGRCRKLDVSVPAFAVAGWLLYPGVPVFAGPCWGLPCWNSQSCMHGHGCLAQLSSMCNLVLWSALTQRS